MSSPGGGAPYRELFLAVSQPMLVERLREYGDVSPASEDEASGGAAAAAAAAAERALSAVDRAHFLDASALSAAYEAYRDVPLAAKDGVSLLAAPSLHLRQLAALAPPLLAPGARRRRVLVMHSGCGYAALALAALLAESQGGGGEVLAADARPECVAAAEAVAASEPYRRVRDAARLRFIPAHDVATALRAADEGAPRALFDAVLLEGATAHVAGALLERLAPGGRLLAPLLPADAAGSWLSGLLHAQSPLASLTLFTRDAGSGAISSAELTPVQGLQAAEYP
jgi:protein-L-isoaspartate O-methyltransferase